MSNVFSRRFFLSALTATAATPLWANPPTQSLHPVPRPAGLGKVTAASADSLIKDAKVSGQVSFAVADIDTGKLLEGQDVATGLPPASVTKALTALYALHYLGPKHRFATRLIAVGTVANGVLKGDLVLRGGGDPTLDTNALAGLAKSLKEAGIREVTGRFLVWGGAMPQLKQIDKKQPVEAGYNPSVSGLSLNYNRVHFEWKRASTGYQITMDARSNKYRPDVSVAKMSIAERQAPVYTYKEQRGIDQWSVARGALGNGGARWLPVRQPEIYAGEVFRTLARSYGVQMAAPKITQSAPRGTVVASHLSAELVPILQGMLKYSTNLTAEMVGIAASQARGAQVLSLKSSAAAMNAWAAETMGMTQAALVDHSGLGEASRLRADELAVVLAAAARRDTLKPILRDISMRADNGAVDKSHPLTVQAKTGTLHFVSGLAGYVTDTAGHELAFAIFVADTDARDRLIGPSRERPAGARTWNSRAKRLQQKLIERWSLVYGL